MHVTFLPVLQSCKLISQAMLSVCVCEPRLGLYVIMGVILGYEIKEKIIFLHLFLPHTSHFALLDLIFLK